MIKSGNSSGRIIENSKPSRRNTSKSPLTCLFGGDIDLEVRNLFLVNGSLSSPWLSLCPEITTLSALSIHASHVVTVHGLNLTRPLRVVKCPKHEPGITGSMNQLTKSLALSAYQRLAPTVIRIQRPDYIRRNSFHYLHISISTSKMAKSFREMLGAQPSTLSPSDSVLVIIDAQNE
jgi:hypothetical protein